MFFVCVMMIVGSCVCVFVVGKFQDYVICFIFIAVLCFSMIALSYNYIALVVRRANSVLQSFFLESP